MTTFISYSRVNSDFAVNIAKDLRSAGFDIWLDQFDIPTGARWDDELEKALDDCSIFLIILSPESSKSQNVRDEIGYAIDAGKHILPVLIKNCKIPLRLRRFQFVDFTDDSYKESLDQIKHLLGNTNELQKGDKDADGIDDDEDGQDSPNEVLNQDADSPLLARGTFSESSSFAAWKSQLPYIIAGVVVIALAFFFIGRFMAARSAAGGEATFVAPLPTSTSVPPTETETSVPTETNTPVEPTSTPIQLTDTPMPTITPVPPVALGEDWKAGCISSLWKAYPPTTTTEKGDGCLKEPVYAFVAENGDLDFLSERSGSGDAEIYGLFAPLPESGSVTFTVRLKNLENVDLLMGVFSEPDATKQGLLMTILSGDVNKRSIIQKDPLNYVTLQGTAPLNQGDGYSISFTFTSLSATGKVNPSVFSTNQVSLRSDQKWLFLGYKGLRGAYRIEGTFLNFQIK